MKRKGMFILIMLSAAVLIAACNDCNSQYRSVIVDAPFSMPPIKEYVFPKRDFSILDYGAVPDGYTLNTVAIAQAIEACSYAGGGRVIVPKGEWLTGPIHMRSNVNLYLSEEC